MNNITLTQIIKSNPEETKPLIVDPNEIAVWTRDGVTHIQKQFPRREYIVKETEDEIYDMIEDAQPQYDYKKDLSITIKLTYDRYGKIQYKSNEYDYTYFTDDFLVILKDNIIIRQISIDKIIDIAYNKKEVI